jgi:hypothetical protein
MTVDMIHGFLIAIGVFLAGVGLFMYGLSELLCVEGDDDE